MLIGLILSLCLNAFLLAAVLFLAYLLKQASKVVLSHPKALHDAPVGVQAAMSVSRQVSGLTAEEEREQREYEKQEAFERAEALMDLGIDPRELARITAL